MVKVNRIYIFPNGTQIDLCKVILVGSLDNDMAGNIFIPIYCDGFNKPIHLILGNSIGKVSEERKQKILSDYSNFSSEWQSFVQQKDTDV